MKKTNFKKIIAFAFVGVFSLGLCLIPLFKTNKVSASNFDFNGTLTYSYMHDVDVIYSYTYNDNYFNYSSYSSSKISSSGVFDPDGSINIDGSTVGFPNYRTLDYLSFYDGHDTFAPKQVDLLGYGYSLNSNNIEDTIYFGNSDDLTFDSYIISFNDLVSIGNFDSFFKSIKLYSLSNIDYCNIYFTYFSESEGDYVYEVVSAPLIRGSDSYYYLNDFSNLISTDFYDTFTYNDISLYYYKNIYFKFYSDSNINLSSFSCKTYTTANGFIDGNAYNSVIYNYNLSINDYYSSNGYDNAMKEVKPFDMIINTVESFLNLEIFPDFHIYYLFMISIGVMTVGLVMKLLLGG